MFIIDIVTLDIFKVYNTVINIRVHNDIFIITGTNLTTTHFKRIGNVKEYVTELEKNEQNFGTSNRFNLLTEAKSGLDLTSKQHRILNENGLNLLTVKVNTQLKTTDQQLYNKDIEIQFDRTGINSNKLNVYTTDTRKLLNSIDLEKDSYIKVTESSAILIETVNKILCQTKNGFIIVGIFNERLSCLTPNGKLIDLEKAMI